MKYFRKDIGHPKKNYLLVYTFWFVIMAASVFIYFAVRGKSLILNSNNDGFVQHYTALVYFGQWARKIIKTLLFDHVLEIPTWTFGLGYGSDIITTLHYYVIGDPLDLLSIIVPGRYTEYLYDFLVILRYYLAGLAFSFYCKEMKKESAATLAGAFTYIFCGFGIFAFRHHFFINPMIYLPLLLAGIERILKKKKPFLFIGMVFVSAISNFYFFYMLVILTGVYTLIRLAVMYGKKKVKEALLQIVRIGLYSVVGVLLSAFIFLPVVLFFLSDSRSGSGYVYDFLYPAAYYAKYLSGFITSGEFGTWTFLGYTPIVLPAIFLLYGRKRNKELKIGFIVLTIFMLFPVFGHIFNGFSYVCNRWNFGYGFLVAFILVTMWPEFTKLSKTDMRNLCIAAAVYALLGSAARSGATKKFFAELVIMMFCILLMSLWNESKDEYKKIRKQTIEKFLFLTAMFGIAVNAKYLNSYFEGNFVDNFQDAGTAWKTISSAQDEAIKEVAGEPDGTDFYRYTCPTGDKMLQNASLLNGISSTQFYWSLQNGLINQFMTEMGNLSNMSYKSWGVDDRTFLNELGSVKYYVTKKSNSCIPFGYKDLGVHSGNYRIYENELALPLGYTYDSYITEEDYEKMSSTQRQEALMQGVVLSENPSGYDPAEIEYRQEDVDFTVACEDGVTWEEGSVRVTGTNQVITLQFDEISASELYVVFEGLDYEEISGIDAISEENWKKMSAREKWAARYKDFHSSPITETKLTLKSDGAKKKLIYYTPENIRYTGRDSFVVNMCYRENERSSITIKFPSPGVYTYSNLKVVAQPMDAYGQQVERLKEDVLENLHMQGNSVSGTISLDENKLLCLTIPYSSGWKAYVDGEETKLLQANTMYMALPLTRGEHVIELEYHTPGLTAGLIGTFAGAALLVIIYITGKRYAKNNIGSSQENK